MSIPSEEPLTEREEWINSFSGIGGRSFIGVRKVTAVPVDFSKFVKPEKKFLGY